MLRAQSDSNLIGSWVRVQEVAYDAPVTQNPKITEADYLKVSFENSGQMKIYASHLANGVQVTYQYNKQIVGFGSGRQFKIEELDRDKLVLVDLNNGEITAGSNRHYYLRESVFLDALPYPAEDQVIIGRDTAYLASKKLYPIFQTTNTPDFHVFIHNQIKSSYSTGENYFHATFMIRPDGSIDHVTVNHRISKANDKRALKAIMASTGRWQLPKLNGKEVNIIMTIEDLFTKRSTSPSANPLKIDLDYSAEDPEVYMNYFNLAVRKILKKEHKEALEYLKLCEDRKPKDPNLPYLRYILYKSLGKTQAATENKTKVQRSRLRYLLKQ